jgi:hypothetical protein
MKLTGIKVTSEGTLQVAWLQGTENGGMAAWGFKHALPTPDGLATALQSIVPLAADVIGIAQRVQAKCAFLAISIKEDKDDARNSYVRITLQAPSATDKPAEVKTAKMATLAVVGKDDKGNEIRRAGAMSNEMLAAFNTIVSHGHAYVKQACEQKPLG